MAEENILSDDLLRQLISVGKVDILVALPTHNHAMTVGQITQMVRAGLLRYFPRDRAAILNPDMGSRDGSPDLVKAASISDARASAAPESLRTLHCISAHVEGSPGRGASLQAILAAADLLRARACAVITPETTSITPEWIERLVRPVYRDEFDLVTPVYRRHAFEGTLITNLLYPVTRALFGKGVREPNPADFAFSSRFGCHLMGQEAWRRELGQCGAEYFFTAAAIAGGFRMHQSFLGPKDRTQHQPADLVIAMRQILGALFWSLGEYYPYWSRAAGFQPAPAPGAECDVTVEPVRVNRKRLFQMFHSGVTELQSVLASILTGATLEQLQRCASSENGAVPYSGELWAKTVYEFAASYQRAVISRDHIIQAMVPLYRGRLHTFLEQNRGASPRKVEENIEALCLTFERLKPDLLSLWTKQEGGS